MLLLELAHVACPADGVRVQLGMSCGLCQVDALRTFELFTARECLECAEL